MVLILEEDARVAAEQEARLMAAGLRTVLAGDLEVGLEFVRLHRPDAVVAAADLEGGVLALCDALQADARMRRCPVLVYARRPDALEAAVLLERGAFDYVPLAISGREWVARVMRSIRQTQPAEQAAGQSIGQSTAPSSVVRLGEIVIDGDACAVTAGGQGVAVTATEFRILRGLSLSAGRVLSRQALAQLAGVDYFDPTDRTIDTHVKNIRRKLGPAAGQLETVRGFGYRMRDAV